MKSDRNVKLLKLLTTSVHGQAIHGRNPVHWNDIANFNYSKSMELLTYKNVSGILYL